MVKERNNGSDEIEADLYDIFMDNSGSQLEQKLLKSKKKLMNAKRGKNEIFEILKLKLKGLDMVIMILQNNKEIIKTEDIYCLDTLSGLLRLAKNDKSLFDPIAKKIKTLLTLILKNQILLNQEDKFEELCKFIVEVMNIHFENSFLQQVIDKIKTHAKFFGLFVDILFKKLFCGRNVSMKVNDVKQLIKYSLSNYGPFYFMDKLMPFLLNKEKGGARTNHQVNGVFSILTYILDSSMNKVKDTTSSDFKDTFLTLENKEIVSSHKKLLETIKENLVFEEKITDEKETSSNSSNSPLKNSQVFVGFINFFDKLSTFMKNAKINASEDEELNKVVKSVSAVLEKVVGQYELKNMQKKLTDIKTKNNAE